jgi:HD superfamily phosphohydrolase
MKPRIFRDPVHGLVGFQGADIGLSRVLDTRAFQRLRRVRQMGFASLVYPGAEHSRFGHALGAFHVAGRVTSALGLEPQVARDVKIAALLHDIGHGPYSHAWEEAFGSISHEDWGRRILSEDAELRGALGDVDPALPARLEAFFSKAYTPRFARKLVSSQLDVDRMDYLLRDAHYSGVGYSTYDLDWIIHALRIAPVRTGDDPDDLVIDYRRGMHAVEQYLSGRFYMYAQVYYHKTVRAAEWMFLLALRRFATLARAGAEPPGLAGAGRIARGVEVSVADYLSLDDPRVQVAFEDWAVGADDPVLKDLTARLGARRLFKTIELGDDPARATALEPQLRAAAVEILGEERAESYWAIDHAVGLGYDSRPGEEIYIVEHPKYGTIDLGQFLQQLPIGKKVFTVRVVCAPELKDRFQRIIEGA